MKKNNAKGKLALLVWSLLCMLMCGTSVYSQTEKNITGTIKDDKGNLLPGASVTVKNTTIATRTDVNGKFSLNVPASAKSLVVTFVGMQEQDVTIGNKTTINVALSSVAATMADIVVIGYGTQKRQDVNGAVSSVSAKDIANLPQPSVDQMLQGKAAGVTVTQNSGAPGSATSVHIRGITSFTQSEPLYVIDGVEVQGNASSNVQLTRPGGGQEETTVSPLGMLNPNDIESIDILKDASATAIYGSRGSNGVVIITTKRGKNGSTVLTYDGFVGVQQQGKFLDVMNLQQYATLENSLAAAFRITPRSEFADPGKLGPGTNWQKAIFQNAMEQSHNISVAGASGKSDYYVSGGYFDQDGTILGYNFKRYTLRASINSQVKDWLRMGTAFGGSRSDQDVGLGSNTGIVYNALLATPDQSVYNADGTYAGPAFAQDGTRLGSQYNPVQQALSISNTLTRSNVNGNLYAEIRFFKDLTLRSEVGGDFNWANAQTFNPSYSYGATGVPKEYWITNPTATLNRMITNSTYWTWKEFFNYSHEWGKHNLTALAGREVWESTWDQVPLSGTGFVAGNGIQSIALATAVGASIAEVKNSQVMESYLARAIYTFDNKYSITANIRSDKSSNFAEGNQTGYFPGAAVSWKLSDEKFMQPITGFANLLKLRIGVGTTGNSNVPVYSYGASLKAVATAFGTGFIINNVANPDLKWETAIQKNIGLDFGLLHSRITGSFDYFDKTSKDFIFQQPLPYFLIGGPNEYSDNPAGIQSPYYNAGKIQNKGFELTVNSKNIEHSDFTWSTSLTFSHYKNTVVSLNGAPAINQSVNLSYISLPATRTVEGRPVGEFYGYKVAGVVKTDAELKYLAANPQNVTGTPQVVTNDPGNTNSIWLGDLYYKKMSSDGKGGVNVNDRVPLGSPNPDFTYGFTNTFTYKDFDLSIFIYGAHGGKILNALKYQTAGLSSLYQNQLASAADYWTPSNPNSNTPAPRAGIGNANLVMSDRFLESASFLRFQNVRLGYTLPADLAKHVAMKSLKAYVSGQNLFVITNYSGLDPEVGSFNQNPTLMNIDIGRYPAPRVFTFGITAQF